MAEALRRTCDATPEPKQVVAVGDCGCSGGIFGESYASCGRVADVIPVDVPVTGCPPALLAILQRHTRRGARTLRLNRFASATPTDPSAPRIDLDQCA